MFVWKRWLSRFTVGIIFVSLGIVGSAGAAVAEDTPSTSPVSDVPVVTVPLPVVVPVTFVSQEPGSVLLPAVPNAVQPNDVLTATWTTVTGVTSTAVTVVDPAGAAVFSFSLWKTPTGPIVVTRVNTVDTVPLHVYTIVPTVVPAARPILSPSDAPARPAKYRVNLDPPAVGQGFTSEIRVISRSRQASMRGRSWETGCTPFSLLREVRVNYWGSDGYRYRGVLIVRADIASAVVRVFRSLYGMKFRFHSVHPVDIYGSSPKGRGANDYASMLAGNTSVFNCRYIVGKEHLRLMSPHASGRAIDINPWENPYVARGGTYPNRWWLHRGGHPMSFLSNTAARNVLIRNGFHWGGGYQDYHHFQR